MINSIQNGCLDELLSICSDEELNSIVNSIMISKISSINKSTLFKKHYPKPTKYIELISDEIRLLGEKSRMNLFNKKESSYDTIVNDVCNILSIPYSNNQTIINEKNILDLYYLENQTLNDISINKYIKLYVSLKGKLSYPAHQVTIPCVLLYCETKTSQIIED